MYTGALRRLADVQLNVVTRHQLVGECDVTPAEVRWKLGRTWRLLLPGVVLLEPGLPSDDQRDVAALLYAGQRSWLAGASALRHHRVATAQPTRRVHVLVPAPHRSRDVAWVSIRRTGFCDERLMERGPLRFSCLPRSLTDAAAASPADDLARAMIVEAVQRYLVRLDDVSHWVMARRPNGRVRLQRALAEAAVGAWSVPEADLGRLLATSHVLPPIWANPTLEDDTGRRLTTPDLWIEDVGMAVMVQSRMFHAGTLQWDETVRAADDLSAVRVVVIGVTPESLTRDPRRVLERVEAAYVAARRTGRRAPVVATPRRMLWSAQGLARVCLGASHGAFGVVRTAPTAP